MKVTPSLIIANRIRYKGTLTFYELASVFPEYGKVKIVSILKQLEKKKLIRRQYGILPNKRKFGVYYQWLGNSGI